MVTQNCHHVSDYYDYYYLLQLSFHSVAEVLTLVTNKKKYAQTKQYKNIVQTVQKHSKYKYTYYQNTHTLQNPHIHTPTQYKTHTYTHQHITKPTHTHTNTLQNPHIHTPTHYKTHTYTHPHITKPVKTTTVQDTHQMK
jgi:hypothetical protein